MVSSFAIREARSVQVPFFVSAEDSEGLSSIAVSATFNVTDVMYAPRFLRNQGFDATTDEDVCISLDGLGVVDDEDEEPVTVSITASGGCVLMCSTDCSAACTGNGFNSTGVPLVCMASISVCQPENFHGILWLDITAVDSFGLSTSPCIPVVVVRVAEALLLLSPQESILP